MDYPALITALPAETITAIAPTSQGLTEASSVEVAEAPTSSALTSRALWLLPPEVIEGSPVIGGYIISYIFELHMTRNNGTNADLEVWAELIRAHFGGRRRPSTITDLLACKVGDTIFRTSEHGGDSECIIEVTFVGIKRPGNT